MQGKYSGIILIPWKFNFCGNAIALVECMLSQIVFYKIWLPKVGAWCIELFQATCRFFSWFGTKPSNTWKI